MNLNSRAVMGHGWFVRYVEQLRQRRPQATEQKRHQPLSETPGQGRIAGTIAAAFTGKIAQPTASDHL